MKNFKSYKNIIHNTIFWDKRTLNLINYMRENQATVY